MALFDIRPLFATWVVLLFVISLRPAAAGDWTAMTDNKEQVRALALGEVFMIYSQWPATQYGNKTSETLTLTTSPGSRIRLEFIAFDTEEYYDYLDFHDGATREAPRTRRFTGNYRPSTVISETNAVTLHFRTNEKTTGSGFRIVCTVVPSLGARQGWQELEKKLTGYLLALHNQLLEHVAMTHSLFDTVRGINNLQGSCASKEDLNEKFNQFQGLIRNMSKTASRSPQQSQDNEPGDYSDL